MFINKNMCLKLCANYLSLTLNNGFYKELRAKSHVGRLIGFLFLLFFESCLLNF